MYILVTYLEDVHECMFVAEQESCENVVKVLSIYFPDYLFEKLGHCRVFAEIVFPHVDDAMQIRHLFDNTSV